MSHLYPIAESADEALTAARLAALTRYEAEALAEGREIVKLETEWLTQGDVDIHQVIDAADAGPGHGFVQRYEDEAGAPVLAVTYWKLGGLLNKVTPPKKAPKIPPQRRKITPMISIFGPAAPNRLASAEERNISIRGR